MNVSCSKKPSWGPQTPLRRLASMAQNPQKIWTLCRQISKELLKAISKSESRSLSMLRSIDMRSTTFHVFAFVPPPLVAIAFENGHYDRDLPPHFDRYFRERSRSSCLERYCYKNLRHYPFLVCTFDGFNLHARVSCGLRQDSSMTRGSTAIQYFTRVKVA